MKNLTKHIKTILLYLVGLSILTYLISTIGLTKITDAITSMSIGYLALVVLLYLVFIPAGAINVWLLLRTVHGVRLSQVTGPYLLSWAVGLFGLGKIGEASLIYFMKRCGIQIGHTSAILLADKLISFVVMLILAVIGILRFLSLSVALRSLSIVVVVGVIMAVVFYTARGRYFIRRYLLGKYAELFTGFAVTNRALLQNYRILLLNVVLTLARFGLATLIIYVTFLGFGYRINGIDILLIYATAQLLSFIPVSINGLGIRESVSVYLYTLIGVAPQIALGRSLIGLSILYILGTITIILLGSR